MRNVFNIKKVKYVEKTQKVIYQGRMKKGSNRKNFEIYSPPRNSLRLLPSIFPTSFPNFRVILAFTQIRAGGCERKRNNLSLRGRDSSGSATEVGHPGDCVDTCQRYRMGISRSTGYCGITFPTPECGREDWTIVFRIREAGGKRDLDLTLNQKIPLVPL